MPNDTRGTSESPGLTIDSFEEQLKRLETIVSQLETGGAPLQDSLALFEEGMDLLKKLQSILEMAETRIEELIGNGTTILPPESVDINE